MFTMPAAVSGWLGVQADLVLQAIGGGLVLFAADLLHQATRPRLVAWRAVASSTADLMWVAATAMLLIALPAMLSLAGELVVIAVAAAVAGLGLGQALGLRRAFRLGKRGRYRYCVAVGADTPPDAMWRAVGAIGDIARYAPTLRQSFVRDDAAGHAGRVPPGVGAVRTCVDTMGKQWSEQCTAYEEGRSFSLRFLAEAKDFPFPVTEMTGGWEVIPVAADRCEVEVWWEFTPKPKALSLVVLALLSFWADRQTPRIVGNMAAQAVEAPATTAGSTRPSALARLLPRFC